MTQTFPGVYITERDESLGLSVASTESSIQIAQIIAGRVLSEGTPEGGQIALVAGDTLGQVSGLNLLAVPAGITLSVNSPVGGLGLFAWVVGDFTQDGFFYALSGPPDSTGYYLNFKVESGTNGGISVIGNSSSGGSVSGLNLPIVPVGITLTVQAPDSSSEGLYAWVVGNPTQDGFQYQLSGLTDSSEYLLNYSYDLTTAGGSSALNFGQSSGQVVGLGLPIAPAVLAVTVQSQDPDGLGMYAWVVGNPTQDGFQYQLSGVPDSGNYDILFSIDTGNQGGVSGIELAFDGLTPAVTNSRGYYSKKVPFDWTGAVTPNSTQGFFSPESVQYLLVTRNLTGQNYIWSPPA